jgi:hypothetical protein
MPISTIYAQNNWWIRSWAVWNSVECECAKIAYKQVGEIDPRGQFHQPTGAKCKCNKHIHFH